MDYSNTLYITLNFPDYTVYHAAIIFVAKMQITNFEINRYIYFKHIEATNYILSKYRAFQTALAHLI